MTAYASSQGANQMSTKAHPKNRAPTWPTPSFRCFPQHRADYHQHPSQSNHSRENGPPRHEPRAGRPKAEHGKRQDGDAGETGEDERIVHGAIDFASGEGFEIGQQLSSQKRLVAMGAIAGTAGPAPPRR